MRQKITRSLLLMMVTALVVTACGNDATETTETTAAAPATTEAASPETTEAAPAEPELEKTDLKVGVIPINDILPLPAGINAGIFEDAGLTVTQENAAGGAAIVPGVVSGEFDIGFSNVYSVMKAAEEGLDIRIIAAGPYVGDTDFSGLSTMDAAITSLADLEGKTISVNTLKGIAEITVRETLEQAGVTDIQLVEIPFPETTAAMEAGQIDAAFQVEPFVGQASRAGATLLAQPFTATQPDMLVAVWFTTQSFIDEHPNTVAAFVDAMNQANEKVQGDRDFANEQLLTYTPTPSIEAAAGTTLPIFKSEIDLDSLQTSAELGIKYGLLEAVPDFGELVR